MSTTYYVSTRANTSTLLRRVDYVDEAFANGKWQPTKEIVDYMFGHDDFIDTINEARARTIAPQAFTSPEVTWSDHLNLRPLGSAADLLGKSHGAPRADHDASAQDD